MQNNVALNADSTLAEATANHSPTRRRDPYLVKSVVHASEILSAFHNNEEELTLKEVVNRCKLPKSMVFRLLYTMERCAIVQKVAHNLYRSTVHPRHMESPSGVVAGGDVALMSPPA